MARRFVDARGTEWEVWEVGARPRLADAPPQPEPRRPWLAGSAERSWLRFESATQRRWLAPYPRWWEALSERELAALCTSAEPDRSRRPIVLQYADVHAGW